MNWFNKRINKFKKKSPFKKAIDIAFLVFIVMMLWPNGRLAIRRVILQSGIMNPDINNGNNRVQISDLDFQNFIFLDENGNQHNLNEYKGKVIFLNFWATWCPPCRAELPDITKLYHSMENTDGIKFLFLSYEKQEVVTSFVRNFGTDIPLSYLTNKTPDIVTPPALPTTFIIDKSGKIVSTTTGMANWDSDHFFTQLQRLIKE